MYDYLIKKEQIFLKPLKIYAQKNLFKQKNINKINKQKKVS